MERSQPRPQSERLERFQDTEGDIHSHWSLCSWSNESMHKTLLDQTEYKSEVDSTTTHLSFQLCRELTKDASLGNVKHNTSEVCDECAADILNSATRQNIENKPSIKAGKQLLSSLFSDCSIVIPEYSDISTMPLVLLISKLDNGRGKHLKTHIDIGSTLKCKRPPNKILTREWTFTPELPEGSWLNHAMHTKEIVG